LARAGTAARTGFSIEQIEAIAAQLVTPLQIQVEFDGPLSECAQRLAAVVSVCLIGPGGAPNWAAPDGPDAPDASARIEAACQQWRAAGMRTLLLVEPEPDQIAAAAQAGAAGVFLNTVGYTNAPEVARPDGAFERISSAARAAVGLGLEVSAGGGLSSTAANGLARVTDIFRLQMGRALQAQALLVGLEKAVRDAKAALIAARLAAFGLNR
jgi:pyridoxine 5-phosphate synthase